MVIVETSIRICYIRVLDTVPGTENNSSWRQELLLFFFLTEYNYHFSDISIEWVKVHLDTVRFNLWHVIWGKFTYLWELSYKLTFSRIYINDLWIISVNLVELDNCVTHSTLAGSIYHIFETKLQNHALNWIDELNFFIKIPVKCHLFVFIVNQYSLSIAR